MKIELKEFINKVPDEIKETICKIITDFKSELQLYYDKTKDKELFQFNEQAFVGLLNNAIVRNDSDNNITTIQEYCVKERKTGKTGRVDLLMYNSEKNICIIFEAKHYYTNEQKDNSWSKIETCRHLNEVIKQAERYYENDRTSNNDNDFYKDKTVYLCAIVFDSLTEINSVEDYLKQDDFKDLTNYYSYTLYEENGLNEVLNIYGMVENKSK